MSFYNELRRRVQRRHYLPDVLKDMVDRIEYIGKTIEEIEEEDRNAGD